MKAILVIDMPESCADCQIMTDKWCYGVPVEEVQNKININKRPKWCPLRPLPIKEEGVAAFQTRDGVWHKPSEVGYAGGWNACIDEILGEDKK